MLVVRRAGPQVSAEDLTSHLSARLAKWWLPDEILFVDELPHTATGKILKTKLREQYKNHRLSSM
jgi:fatty-acyl-CoA synthase